MTVMRITLKSGTTLTWTFDHLEDALTVARGLTSAPEGWSMIRNGTGETPAKWVRISEVAVVEVG